jgi:riboflavin kinase/FMN adenylyltransferase
MSESEAAVVSIGTFDGVHRGHRAILDALVEEAARRRLTRRVLAFSEPPRCEREGWHARRCVLTPPDVRGALLRGFVDHVTWLRFPELRDHSADAFVQRILLGGHRAAAVVVGERFRFGHERAGDAAFLRERLGEENVIVVGSLRHGGRRISSSRIRGRLRRGDIRAAAAMLGRPPLIAGEVTPGDRIGSALGFPTINLEVSKRLLLPADGVYFAYAYAAEVAGPGLLYVGTRPTIGDGGLRVELHLLDRPPRPPHGQPVEVHLLARQREDRRFPSKDALRHAQARDVREARERWARAPSPPSRVLGCNPDGADLP